MIWGLHLSWLCFGVLCSGTFSSSIVIMRRYRALYFVFKATRSSQASKSPPIVTCTMSPSVVIFGSAPTNASKLLLHAHYSPIAANIGRLIPAVSILLVSICLPMEVPNTNPCSVCLTMPPRFPVCFPVLPPSTTKRSSWKNCDTTVCLYTHKIR